MKYKRKSALVKREIRKLLRQSWNNYTNIEQDVHGCQEYANKVLREINKDEKDQLYFNTISEKEWLKYYKELWTNRTQE
jgi:hypothetical protein